MASFFRTAYDNPARAFRAVPGSRIIPRFAGSYDDLGRFHVKQVGTQDIYASIQSHADSCDIHSIMKRFQSGEVDVLSKVQGFFGDVTGMPQTFAEALNTIHDSETFFNGLPSDVKSRFNNSFSQFLTASQQPDFLVKAGFVNVSNDITPPKGSVAAEGVSEPIKESVSK